MRIKPRSCRKSLSANPSLGRIMSPGIDLRHFVTSFLPLFPAIGVKPFRDGGICCLRIALLRTRKNDGTEQNRNGGFDNQQVRGNVASGRRWLALWPRVDSLMTGSAHILVVDDARDIREPLAKYLAKNGYRVSQADSAAKARQAVKDGAIDMVILDIMMPGEDGLSLCRHLRETSQIPIILLTAMTEETDRIVGLEMGADDYVVKPFNPRELLARIKAVLRRFHSLPPEHNTVDSEQIRFDDWTLDIKRRELVGSDGVTTPLSTGEFNLLTVFLRHPDRVLSRDQLLDLTQSRAADAFDRSIDNQVSRLRKKIEIDIKTPQLIKTVWGGGYRFQAVVERQ